MNVVQTYFPDGLDEEIKQLLVDYINIHSVTYKLAGLNPQFKIVELVQKGFTVINRSIVFRVLVDYQKEGQIAVNFPNWRGWEKVLPLQAANHFCVNKKNMYLKSGYHHGYYHSFLFETKDEFIDFFYTYMMGFSTEK